MFGKWLSVGLHLSKKDVKPLKLSPLKTVPFLLKIYSIAITA